VGTNPNDGWIVVIRYIKEGYIKEDDAKNWNADDLLKNISESVEEANKYRAARGFPEMQVIGWIEPPTYDATTHRLVWSMLGKDKGQSDDVPKNVNYNTYALGRDGYFSLNLLSVTKISAPALIVSPNTACWRWSAVSRSRSSACSRWPRPWS
jgi:uncharacterized membrane-anchored protein